jgi:hypothetical protein
MLRSPASAAGASRLQQQVTVEKKGQINFPGDRLSHEQCEWLDHDPRYLAQDSNEVETRERHWQFLQAAIQ